MSELNKPHFQDADKAREYLEAVRWPEGAICPHCGVVGNHYALTGKSTRVDTARHSARNGPRNSSHPT
jgi:hypothetical protein